ncbi:hypothetical protein N0V82_000285 [Gnomoniopsis sp. IMI 355080]|nr:hypothetical protein N0V82_000285 [Gnomoniopsis sp. IMI 355080]
MSAAVEANGANMDEDEQLSPRTTAMRPMEFLVSLEGRTDPDAPATVTDFLEFTEHLPADMMRSLTLIGKLDNSYADASLRLHELTKLWGQLPSLPANSKPGSVKLRGNISEAVNKVLTSRVYSHAEAVRMADNVNRHVNRLKLIHAKLRTMLENYPAEDEPRSPVAHPRSPQATRANKRQPAGGEKGRRPRVPRITVPGEVLAPYDVGYDTYSGESDSSADEDEDEDIIAPGRRRTPGPMAGSSKPRGRKPLADKPPKVPKPRKIPKGSQVSANAANPPLGMPAATAPLKPPPENAVPGSDDAPWLQLTQWELSKLRKRMKKNSAWIPSDTMINRELKHLGRGYDGWASAKKKAEEEGLPFEPTLPRPIVDDTTGFEHLPMGAVSMDSAIKAEDRTLTNRGHELNKAKKLKKDRLSDQAAKEAEDSARRFALLARNFEVSFQHPQPSSSQPAAKNTKRQQKKRKRDSVSEADAEKPEASGQKRSKTETPVPIPPHINLPRHTPAPPNQVTPAGTQAPLSTTPVPIPIPGADQSIMVGAKSSFAASPAPSIETGTTTTTIPTKAPADGSSSPKRQNAPILPPTREMRSRDTRSKEKTAAPPPIKTSSSGGNTPSATTPVETSRRPSSRGQDVSQQKQGLAAERPRRASTARNTPAPEPSLRQASKRTKRPIPGTISRTNSGGNNSAITKRKAAPKKSKRGAGAGAQKKAEAETEIEVDEEGNVIDPNEARYCICNRVSFGTMVMCENAESVSDIPPSFAALYADAQDGIDMGSVLTKLTGTPK